MVVEILGNIKDLRATNLGILGLDLYDSQRFNKGLTFLILLHIHTIQSFLNFTLVHFVGMRIMLIN